MSYRDSVKKDGIPRTFLTWLKIFTDNKPGLVKPTNNNQNGKEKHSK